MVIKDFQDRQINDVIYIAGTGYIITRILSNTAYAHRVGTAHTKTYLIQPEGTLFTVSEIKGDKAMPWTYVGCMHYLKPIDLHPDLE